MIGLRGRPSTRPVLVGLAVVAVLLSGCVPAAPAAGPDPGEERVATSALGTDCRVADVDEGADRDHLDPATAPPAAALYRQVPPTGGRHFGQVHPLVIDVKVVADVRATTHNLEHGAVLVHVDAVALGGVVADDVEAWATALEAAGFRAAEASAGILVVGMPPEATTDAAIALRAWGHGIDCDAWDPATADGFVASYFGDRGDAPEGGLAPYPDDNGLLLDPGQFA